MRNLEFVSRFVGQLNISGLVEQFYYDAISNTLFVYEKPPSCTLRIFKKKNGAHFEVSSALLSYLPLFTSETKIPIF